MQQKGRSRLLRRNERHCVVQHCPIRGRRKTSRHAPQHLAKKRGWGKILETGEVAARLLDVHSASLALLSRNGSVQVLRGTTFLHGTVGGEGNRGPPAVSYTRKHTKHINKNSEHVAEKLRAEGAGAGTWPAAARSCDTMDRSPSLRPRTFKGPKLSNILHYAKPLNLNSHTQRKLLENNEPGPKPHDPQARRRLRLPPETPA